MRAPLVRDVNHSSTSRSVLILTAGVGRGHQSAAKGLRDELLHVAPDIRVTIQNGLGTSRGLLRVFLEHFTRWQLTHCPATYSLSYLIVVRWSWDVGSR
jgi:hypothetical protein